MEQEIIIKMTEQEAIKYYANKIIEDSLEQCSEFNYCYEINNNVFIKEHKEEILQQLKIDERIANVFIDEKTQTFDMVFWLDYCSWYYEEYDLKLENQIVILEKLIQQLEDITTNRMFLLNMTTQKLISDVININKDVITEDEKDNANNMLKHIISETDFYNKYLDKYKVIISYENISELQQELQEKLKQLEQQLLEQRKSKTEYITKEKLDKMLKIYNTDKNFTDDLIGIFIYKDSDKWLGIDNREKNLWIEEFEKEEYAIKFLYE